MKVSQCLPVMVVAMLPAFGNERAFAQDNPNSAPSDKAKITIKEVPSIPPGEGAMDDINGSVTVTNGKPSDYKVVIYAYGDKWYVQPTAAEPLTDIDEDGKWEAKTHGGLEYAVLLVKPSFKPPATCDTLPKVGPNILAVVKKKPKK